MTAGLFVVYRADGSREGGYTDPAIASQFMRSAGAGSCVVKDGAVVKVHVGTTTFQRKRIEHWSRTGVFTGSRAEPPAEAPTEPTPAPKSEEAPVSSKICSERGCTNPPARDRIDSPEHYRGKCRPCRSKTKHQVQAKEKREARVSTVPVEPTPAQPYAQPYAKVPPSSLADQVVRSLAIVDRLGGVERAEQLVALVEQFATVPR